MSRKIILYIETCIRKDRVGVGSLVNLQAHSINIHWKYIYIHIRDPICSSNEWEIYLKLCEL